MRSRRLWWIGWLCLSCPLFASASEPALAAWTQRRIEPALRDNWAFRPLQTVTVPESADDTSTNPIDAFLGSAQRNVGLTPHPAVDRRTLLRRLSFTLTGLPPSDEVVSEFVADGSPDAVERCVDRLLSSPHYGMRWARHWLDIARFAESHGYEHDYDRPTAFHYRDFVVHAWNTDLSFDEFVRWQIAGDRLAPDQRFAWMATGFLAAGPHSTQITKREVERQRYDELDDMVSTMGTALLGLNVGCARCHDHPHDPIPQADFYRLAAYFTRTVRSDVEFDFDPAGYRVAFAAFKRQHAALDEAVSRYEASGLRQAYRKWRSQAASESLQTTWLLPSQMTISSSHHAPWTQQADGSWRVTAAADEQQVDTIILKTQGARLTAIRLEALTDPSMVHGGPGRDPAGNFLLSRVQVTSRHGDDVLTTPQAISRMNATFEQVGLGLVGVLDDRDETGWGVDPQLGRPHAALFQFSKPVDLQAGEELTLRLEFKALPRASLGRLRVSFSTVPAPALEAASPPMPERVVAALRQHPSTLSEESWTALTRWFAPRDEEWQRLDARRQDHGALAPQPQLQTVLVATEGRPAIRLHTQAQEEFLPDTKFLTRGDPAQPVGVAQPGVLQVLDHGDPAHVPNDRAALARWVTDDERGAGALLARVIVNRLWQHHFGSGLVATPDDFGTRGAPLHHPELLEWLAGELVRHDWHLKPLQRLMVTSTAYRRSSFPAAKSIEIDPDNHLFARWSSRRLEAEALRDAMLVASDSLDDRLDGPSERAPLHSRRSLYTFLKRSAPDAWLAAFDAPDGCRVTGRRPQTTSPAQALAVLNSEQSRRMATHLANRCLQRPADPIRYAFQSILQRVPSLTERDRVARMVNESGAMTVLDRWTDLCQVLLSLDEFVFLD